jgi:hypothetical protein
MHIAEYGKWIVINLYSSRSNASMTQELSYHFDSGILAAVQKVPKGFYAILSIINNGSLEWNSTGTLRICLTHNLGYRRLNNDGHVSTLYPDQKL